MSHACEALSPSALHPGQYYEIGDRVVIGGDEACVVSTQKGRNGQNVFGVDYHDGLTTFEVAAPIVYPC